MNLFFRVILENMEIRHDSRTRTTVRLKNKTITLIGTAHISGDSVREIENVIEEISPDRICIELDESRYKTITEGRRWEEMNISKVIREKKGFLLLANLVLSSFQKRMGSEVGVNPGADMKEAVLLAKEKGIPYSLIDREIQITLRRAWRISSFFNKMKLLSALLASAFTREKITDEDIENMKEKTALDGMMEELSEYLPSVKTVLIDERDTFLASKTYTAEGENIIAVVGAGHVPGMLKNLEAFEKGEKPTCIDSINFIPEKRWGEKAVPWILPGLILAVFIGGFFITGTRTQTVEKIVQWILINGTLSAIGSLIALAHPLTIIASFIAAPITSLNPFIGVGMVTGLSEAFLRKPKVIDFNHLNDDIASLRGFYRNRVTRIFLVFLLSGIGSSIGTFIGAASLAPLVGNIVNEIAAFFRGLIGS